MLRSEARGTYLNVVQYYLVNGYNAPSKHATAGATGVNGRHAPSFPNNIHLILHHVWYPSKRAVPIPITVQEREAIRLLKEIEIVITWHSADQSRRARSGQRKGHNAASPEVDAGVGDSTSMQSSHNKDKRSLTTIVYFKSLF